MKAIISARVSSREQEETGYSLPAQIKFLEEYAAKNSLEVVKKYSISESASGKQIRKSFVEMLDYATKHDIPIILCEKIDRLTRNLKDAALVADWIESDPKRQVHFAKENFILNQATRAHENLVWDMKVSIARFYTNNLAEEVKKGQKEKLHQGWLPHRAKLGYKTIGEKGHKTHVIDDAKAPLVREMFELYSTGNYSVSALADAMYKNGLRNLSGGKVSKSRIHQLLSDPYYHGRIAWMGEFYDGNHEPIISKELFVQVQARLNRGTASPQYRKHLPVFKAKMNCGECGGMITWETQKGHWYGHCNHYKPCSQKGTLRQEKVEAQLGPHFAKVALKSERVLEWLKQALKEHHAEERSVYEAKTSGLQLAIDRAQRRIENMYDDKLDGKISGELYDKKLKEFVAQKDDAMEHIQKLSADNTRYYEAGYSIHELASKAWEIYQSPKATTEEKRELLSYAFSNLTLKDQEITPKYTLAFEFVSEWIPRLNATFELAESLDTKGQSAVLTASRPALLPLVNDVITYFQTTSEYIYIPDFNTTTGS
jgi:DNA invertase Pin-like site-specific DNA recombinase